MQVYPNWLTQIHSTGTHATFKKLWYWLPPQKRYTNSIKLFTTSKLFKTKRKSKNDIFKVYRCYRISQTIFICLFVRVVVELQKYSYLLLFHKTESQLFVFCIVCMICLVCLFMPIHHASRIQSVSCKQVRDKDTNRKIRETEFIYICGSKNGSSISTVNTGKVWGDVSHGH